MNTVKRFYFYLSDFSRKLQEISYFPEYSGIFLILSIERVSPGGFLFLQKAESHDAPSGQFRPRQFPLHNEIIGYIIKEMSPVAKRNSTEFLSYVAVFGIGISVCAYFYAKGREGTVPDYVNDPNTWVSYNASGTENKRADLFYAHPTTAAGLIRWNIA